MGSGLTRAAQAAARTRWDGRLTPEMRAFLAKLATSDEPMTRGQIGCVVTRADASARSKCSKLGLAQEARRKSDDKVGWQITGHGRDALARDAIFRPSAAA
jgi:hypothetical protein